MPADRRNSPRRLLVGLAGALIALAAHGQDAAKQPRSGPGPGAAEAARLDEWLTKLQASASGEWGEQVALSPEEETALLAQIVALPRALWQPRIESLVQSPPHSSDRRVAVRLLGAGGRAEDLVQLVQLAQAEEEGDLLERSFAEVFEPAVTALVQRDPRAGGELRRSALKTTIGVRRSLAHGLGDVGDQRALEELAALLSFDEALDPTLLAQIARVARGVPQPYDASVLAQVRNSLTVEEPQVLSAAAGALGALEDLHSVDALIELLEHETTCVRGSAHRALKQICGVNFPAERARWEPWLAEERAWYAERSAPVIADLASANRMTLVAALNEVGVQRLFRRELAEEVAAILERGDAQDKLLACQTLAQLGSRTTLPSLVSLLEDPDADLSAAAWAAIQVIAGDDLPPEASAWGELNGLIQKP
jgi:HEAT repeat protein